MSSSKIILYTHSDPQLFPPIINAANILYENGYDVYLVGYHINVPGNIILNKGINSIYFGNLKTGYKGVIQYFLTYPKLLKLVYSLNPAWLISYDAYAAMPSRVICALTNSKWIYYQLDFWDNPEGFWQKLLLRLERLGSKYANLLSFPQTERAEIFIRQINKAVKYLIIHNGPRKNWLTDDIKPHPIILKLKKEYKNILVYQGGWSFQFGLEMYINALSFAKTEYCILFIGKEHEAGIKYYLQKLALEKEVNHKVFFHSDYVPYNDIQSITKYCTAGLAILYDKEAEDLINIKYLAGASNKLGEYIACGLPIISVDSTSNRNFYEKYGTACLCGSMNAHALSNTIDDLLSNRHKHDMIEANNKKIFSNVLNFDYQFSKLIKHIETN